MVLESIYNQGQICWADSITQSVVYRKMILERWDVEGKDHTSRCNFLLVDRLTSATALLCLLENAKNWHWLIFVL